MPIAFNECRAILEQFKRAHPEVLMIDGFHGLQVEYDDERPVICILASEASHEEVLTSAISNAFSYKFDSRESSVSVKLKITPIAKSHVGVQCHPGDTASGDPQSFYGTLGWNFYLNGGLLCLSNWHVFCARGNDTPIGWNISINGSTEATLRTFQPLYPSGNIWDYALAKYIQPTDAAGIMRQCDGGIIRSYPSMLSPENSVFVGGSQTYYKVGARSPICRTGTLIAVGDRVISYDDGSNRSFQHQLIFSKMSDPGDSGAVIVLESDTSVTGLNFAGDDASTIANPIYLAGWQHTGVVRFTGGMDIPMFVGSLLPSSATFLGNINREPASRVQESPFQNTSLLSNIPNDRLYDIPFLSAGKLFLGIAEKWRGGDWRTHPPPPIRNVSVDSIYVSSKFGGGGPGSGNDPPLDLYLCFG